MIFIGIPGGNGGDVAGKLLLSFITEGDKKVILPIPIKRSYYFHSSKRLFWEWVFHDNLYDEQIYNRIKQ